MSVSRLCERVELYIYIYIYIYIYLCVCVCVCVCGCGQTIELLAGLECKCFSVFLCVSRSKNAWVLYRDQNFPIRVHIKIKSR